MGKEFNQNERKQDYFRILTGKSTGKRPLGMPRRRWENNIRIYLKEIRIDTRNWIDHAQGRDYCKILVNAGCKLRAL